MVESQTRSSLRCFETTPSIQVCELFMVESESQHVVGGYGGAREPTRTWSVIMVGRGGQHVVGKSGANNRESWEHNMTGVTISGVG